MATIKIDVLKIIEIKIDNEVFFIDNKIYYYARLYNNNE